ncbi:MAG: hypothetical protein WD883_01325 [Candidatus Colwellbacteria bacterium]
MTKELLIGGLVGITALFFIGFLSLSNSNTDVLGEVDDFDSCVSAPGSVIMESYPEQCRTRDGRTFVNEEQRRDFDEDEEEPNDATVGDRCQSAGGTWTAEHKECGGVSSDWCAANGGDFNDCASACRHNVDPGAPCILLCVQICQF